MIDFEITDDDSIYIIKKDLTVELLNTNLTSVWKSKSKLINQPTAIAVRNSSLFTYNYSHIYKINKTTFEHSVPMTNEVPISEPYQKVAYKREHIGFERDEVLRYDKSKKQWYRFIDLPFSVGNATEFNNELIISNESLEQYYTIDLTTGEYLEYRLPKTLFNSESNRVVSFKIEQGSQGCFHNDTHSKEYNLRGDFFKLEVEDKEHANHFLPSMPSQIAKTLINDIISEIDISRTRYIKVEDIRLTEKDIKSYKAFVDDQEKRIKQNGIDRFNFDNPYSFPGENINFQFYKDVIDSLNSIPDSVIHGVFNRPYGSWSTTTDWQKLTFIFQDGSVLTVSNADDRPNYMYAPWIVDYNGLKFKSTSFELGHSLNELTKGKLFKETSQDKKYALFQIADYLYRASLK